MGLKQGSDKYVPFCVKAQMRENVPSTEKWPKYVMLSQKIGKMGNIVVVSRNAPLFMCLKHRLEVKPKVNRNFEKNCQ